MARTLNGRVLSEVVWTDGAIWTKRVALVALGIAAMAIAAKVKVPFWPVPITMQSFVVLSVGAAYGMRLGAVTLLGYLAIGALGFDIFTSSSASNNGLAYMMAGTGGYLVGFLLAVLALGALARIGWDRSPLKMAGAMLIGEVLIFLPGVLWLGHLYAADKGWAWVMEWGLTAFLPAEALKLALAAVLFPLAWRAVGRARG
ncbi:biotin transporter BioY [Paralimibaculum aggregatum]|uniref:Biotin transporter n=1 Tax=Paralimibaculum aggregatum TaxID=3036245 RepID=A0ABQ6LBJ2_9RHOB|nr:biotin transporter BioY [Limibaculum sp. NKW23]GMG80790.1 biotin transporter BioY [Limibaculum sp. NKW23]